jgi:hypothetical protein
VSKGKHKLLVHSDRENIKKLISNILASDNSSRIDGNVLLCITLNIALTTATSFFMSPSINQGKLLQILSQYYGLSIIALIFCYILMQFNKADAISVFDKFLIVNLLLTNLLLLFLKIPPTNPTFVNQIVTTYAIVPLMTIAVIFNLVMPSVAAVCLFYFAVFRREA